MQKALVLEANQIKLADAVLRIAELQGYAVTPVSPTVPVTDDMDDTFGWTNVEGFNNVEDYEYTKEAARFGQQFLQILRQDLVVILTLIK